MSDCAHPELRISGGGVFCNNPDCGIRIDDDMSPIAADPRADLHLVHEIDQAHASALQRVGGLLDLLDKWQKQSINSAAKEAAENPMVFYAIVQVFRTRVDVDELPYILSAAVMELAKARVPE